MKQTYGTLNPRAAAASEDKTWVSKSDSGFSTAKLAFNIQHTALEAVFDLLELRPNARYVEITKMSVLVLVNTITMCRYRCIRERDHLGALRPISKVAVRLL
jgi:hypothetical protein